MRRGVLAEFETPEELLRAVEALRTGEYTRLETYAPIEMPHVERLVTRRPTILPRLVLAAGLAGGAGAYALQWFVTVRDYPLDVGGRPLHSVPSFLVSTFEFTLLSAAVAAFVGVLAILRLPRPWHPVFEIEGFERASIDRYWVGVDARDPRFDADACTRLLVGLRPIRVARLPEHVPVLPPMPHWVRWFLGRA